MALPDLIPHHMEYPPVEAGAVMVLILSAAITVAMADCMEEAPVVLSTVTICPA